MMSIDYFKWLCKLIVYDDIFSNKSYNRLLSYLYSIDFYHKMLMDSNRSEDGLNLRYRYASEHDIRMDAYMYFEMRGVSPICSVLEMMVALAIRFEDSMMTSSEFDNRTGFWFYCMLDNLGLSKMTDQVFDLDYCEMVIENFLNRDYEPDGKGNIFYIPGCQKDLRKIEIWYQAMEYFDSILKDKYGWK